MLFFSLHFKSLHGHCGFFYFVVVRLGICTAWCVFSSFVKHFHFQISVERLTDWSSVGLWACFSESLSLLFLLLLFSLSDTIKQKHISKPSERGIFLFIMFHSSLPCLLSSLLAFIFLLCYQVAPCVAQFILFCIIYLNVISYIQKRSEPC